MEITPVNGGSYLATPTRINSSNTFAEKKVEANFKAVFQGVETMKNTYVKQGNAYVQQMAQNTNFHQNGPKIVKMNLSALRCNTAEKANSMAPRLVVS